MLDRRQESFREFKQGVFNVLKLALAYDLNRAIFEQYEKTIRLTMPAEARAQMLAYTDTIEVSVSGRQWQAGWWFAKKTTHKHITADILFNPYRMTLSAWTDPKAEGGIVCFE